MVNGIDYNGKQGRHPSNCDCVKHLNQTPTPMSITQQGESIVTNQTLDPTILQALASNPTALSAYIASVNNAPSIATNQIQVPATQIPPLPMLDEYVIPLTDPIHKQTGFSTMGDARNLPSTFNSNTEAVRITKVYANKQILGTDKWELVLRKIK